MHLVVSTIRNRIQPAIHWLGSLAALPWLAGASVAYFVAVRLLQDRLYAGRDWVAEYGQYFPGYQFRPEPYETPLYLLGFLLIPLVALTLRWMVQRRWLRLIAGILAAVALPVVAPRLWSFIGSQFVKIAALAPAAQDYFQRRTVFDLAHLLLTKRSYVMIVLATTALAVAILAFWRLQPRHVHHLQAWWRAATARPVPWWQLWVLLAGLALLLWHPNLAVEESHYDYWLGPVNDTLRGKRWLLDVTNQYGVFNHLVVLALFVLLGGAVSYGPLMLLIQFSYFVFFALLLWFLWAWLRSWPAALAGLGLGLAVMYGLPISPAFTPYHFANIVPLRYGWYAFALLPLLQWARLGSATPAGRRWREVLLVIVGLAPLWIVDFGLYLVGTTVVVLAVDAVRQPGSWPVRAGRTLLLVARMVLYGALAMAAVSVGVWLAYGAWPNWGLPLAEVEGYRLGRALNPLPVVGYFFVYVVVYLAALLWVGRRWIAGQATADDTLVLFLAVLGALSLNYYIGNSAWNLLHPVAGPLILLLTFAAHRFLHDFTAAPSRVLRGGGALFAALAVFTLGVLAVKLPVELSHRDYGRIGWPLVGVDDAALWRDALRLRHEYPALARVPLIHQQGNKLMLFARRTNHFPIFELSQLYFVRQMDELIAVFRRAPTPEIFVGTQRDPQMEYFVDRALADYRVVARYETLEIFALATTTPPAP